MKLYAKPKDARTMRVLAVAKYNEVDVDNNASAGDDPSAYFGKIPVLDTGKGPAGAEQCVFTTNAIARYLARTRPDLGLYGQNLLESGEVDSWMEFTTTELEVPLYAWCYPLLGYFPDVPEATAAAKIDVAKCVKVLDAHLLSRTFMVGQKLTLADIHIASVLYVPCVQLKGDGKTAKEVEGIFKQFPNVARWWKLVTSQGAFKKVFGDCSTGAAAAQGGKKQEGKKQEGKKQEGKKQDRNSQGGKENQNQKKGGEQQKGGKQENQSPKKGGDQGKKDKKQGGKDAKAADPKAAEKLLKACIKEGGKRGVELEGARDMGGPEFYNNTVLLPEGRLDLLKAGVEAMNAECKPDDEERKGGAGGIGKMIYCCATSGDNLDLAVVCNVPEEMIVKHKATAPKLSAATWLKDTLTALGKQDNIGNKNKIPKDFVKAYYVQSEEKTTVAKTVNGEKKHHWACAVIKCGGTSDGLFPIKVKDEMINRSNDYLRSVSLLASADADDDDDDEYVFGDDDFPE